MYCRTAYEFALRPRIFSAASSKTVSGAEGSRRKRMVSAACSTAELDLDFDIERMPPLWFSVATDSTRSYEDVVIEHVGIVERTAQTGTAPIKFLPGQVSNSYDRSRWKLPHTECSAMSRTWSSADGIYGASRRT